MVRSCGSFSRSHDGDCCPNFPRWRATFFLTQKTKHKGSFAWGGPHDRKSTKDQNKLLANLQSIDSQVAGSKPSIIDPDCGCNLWGSHFWTTQWRLSEWRVKGLARLILMIRGGKTTAKSVSTKWMGWFLVRWMEWVFAESLLKSSKQAPKVF